VQLHGREPEDAVDRSSGDVHELHAAVRHHGQSPDHDATANQQIVLAFGITPRAVAPPVEQSEACADDRRNHRDHETSERADRDPDADPAGKDDDGGNSGDLEFASTPHQW
jgi:hypothetical protein